MNEYEFKEFVSLHVQPAMLDIEAMKRAILEEMSATTQGVMGFTQTDAFISNLGRKMARNLSPVTLPGGYLNLTPDLNELKAEITVKEALQLLHSSGVLVAIGGIDTFGPDRNVYISTPSRSPATSCRVYMPSVHLAYRLAIPFEKQSYRLASADIYLTRLNQSLLPSRAKRCLTECINAFRHGLYLSATMSLGAASESLWMQLARLLYQKKPGISSKIGDQLKRGSPSISTVIDETWQVLVSNYAAELKLVFSNDGERDLFKKRADRLFRLRNYAMHSDDAHLDEPLFTYDETGMLLLDSANYFNKLMDITSSIS